MKDPGQTGKDRTTPVGRFIAKGKARGQFHRIIIALLNAMLEEDSLFIHKNANDPTTEMPFVSLSKVLRLAEAAGSDEYSDPLPSLEELEELCLQWEEACLLDIHKDGNGDSPLTRTETRLAFPNMLHA